jgi:hypothetical protein
MTKELCKCGKVSVWVYLPGYSSGDTPYSCDDCVPRGCECNYAYLDEIKPLWEENVDWKWIEKDVRWTALDTKQREYPCAEYEFDPDGFEREINPHIIKMKNYENNLG